MARLLDKLKEKKSGDETTNIKRYLMNLKKKSQVNLYLYFQKEIVNSKLKQTLQDM